MGSNAKRTQARIDGILRAVGRACDYEVNRGAGGLVGITVSDVLDKGGIRQSYCDQATTDWSRVLGDMNLLAEYDYVGVGLEGLPEERIVPGGVARPDKWRVWLRPEGLKRLVELEKPYWRHVHDIGPGTFWLAVFALLSFVVAVVALIRTF